MIVQESLQLNSFVNGDDTTISSNTGSNQLSRGQGKKGRTGTGPLKPYRPEDLAWVMYQKRWGFEKDLDF